MIDKEKIVIVANRFIEVLYMSDVTFMESLLAIDMLKSHILNTVRGEKNE